MAAKYLNVQQIIAIDIIDSKLELAKELGATDLINSLKVPNGDIISAIKSLTPDKNGPNFAIDCTGAPKVIQDLLAIIAPAGTATIVGAPPPGFKLEVDPFTFLMKGQRLIGVVEGDSDPEIFIPELIAMHKEGKFPLEKLVTVYPAEKLDDAIKDIHDGKVCVFFFFFLF